MMDSKKFVQLVCNTYGKDKMSLFDTIIAIKNKYNIEQEDVVSFLKTEKTLLKDLHAECVVSKLIKTNNKSLNIEELF